MGTRADNKQRRRKEALRAARTIIETEGVDALSMRRLSSVAGMAVNTLYALFDSHEGILQAITQDGISRARSSMETELEGDPLEQLQQMMRVVLNQIITEERHTKPMYRTLSQHRNLRKIDANQALNVVTMMFDKAIKAKLLRQDAHPRLLAHQLLKTFRETATEWAFEELNDDQFRTYGHFHMAMVLAAVATPETAAQLQGALTHTQQQLISLL